MVFAVEHIRRMRGGAQSHLMRCDDGAYYIVKFQNNLQHLRVLANEMLGTKLAGSLGLRVPQTEVVEVRRELIELTAECTRGFVQALSLSRDPGQAKVLAFIADAIRQKLAHPEFVAITEGNLTLRKMRAIALFLACSRRVKSALCPWGAWRNGLIACGPVYWAATTSPTSAV